ncbi:MAG: alpha/beta hydrolase [Treponema sp.]|nr:alpha/beta hydrolase [Treponema sp.]
MYRIFRRSYLFLLLLLSFSFFSACQRGKNSNLIKKDLSSLNFTYREYPLERNSLALHLDCMKASVFQEGKNILLIHGVTYSSREFDVNYQDYSLVRYLASEGYAVWTLDIAGFGRSQPVEDGFMPDSNYAAEDIKAAVDKIIEITGQDKIDLLGWSWGTVTTGKFVGKHPEHIRKLILYAPILSGIGEYPVNVAFHKNDWEHAADDFQKNEKGEIDFNLVDPLLVEVFCSNCWHYDRDSSPNGGRRDICVASSNLLIDLDSIKIPTLVICGDKDPYLNYPLVNNVLDHLPQGSKLEVLKGASHVAYIEKDIYRDFQNKLMDFLSHID